MGGFSKKKIRIVFAALLALVMVLALAGCAGETKTAEEFSVTAEVLTYQFDVGEEGATVSAQLNMLEGSNNLEVDVRWYTNAAESYDNGDQITRDNITLPGAGSDPIDLTAAVDTSEQGVTYYYVKAFYAADSGCSVNGVRYYANSPIIMVVVGDVTEGSGAGSSMADSSAVDSSMADDSATDSSATDSSATDSSATDSSATDSSATSSSATNEDTDPDDQQPEYQFYITGQPGAGPIKFTTGSQAVISMSAYSSATPAANLRYQWYTNTANSTEGAVMLTGQTNPALTIASQNPSSQFYFCVVGDPATNQTRQTGITHVLVEGEPIGQGQNWVEVSIVGFSIREASEATASGAGTISYQWYASAGASYSGTAISGQNGSILNLTEALWDGGYRYIYCVATSTLNGNSVSSSSNILALVN